GTIYVTTGGGGAPLNDRTELADAPLSAVFEKRHHWLTLRISPEAITATARDERGEAFDRFTIAKGERPVFTFVRGDAARNGGIGIADPIAILNYLHAGGDAPCLASSDANADGAIDLADPVHLLAFLFADGAPPPPPYPSCGTADGALEAHCRGPCVEAR
ncbi:MAG: hypothetical protein JXP34_12755, partial [Planctomycetes bacterium]|nr:hypothetical protein [Planctomycetota bacterium]